MRFFYSIILFALLFPFLAFSQSNYRPGYIVKNTGDTVKGYINYREWNTLPKKIEFKQSTADQPVQALQKKGYREISR